MHILALLAGNIGSTMWLNQNTVDTDPTSGSQPGVPTIYGWDARKIGMAAGVAAALGLVGGPLGMLLIGAGLASYNSQDAAKRWTDAWSQFMSGQAALSEEQKGGLAKGLKALGAGMFDFLSKDSTDVAGDSRGTDGVEDYAPALPGIC